VEINGPFATLFHYGNVHIQTAARTTRFEIRQISEPTEVRTKILSLYDDYTHHLARRVHHPVPPSDIAPNVENPNAPASATTSPVPENNTNNLNNNASAGTTGDFSNNSTDNNNQ